ARISACAGRGRCREESVLHHIRLRLRAHIAPESSYSDMALVGKRSTVMELRAITAAMLYQHSGTCLPFCSATRSGDTKSSKVVTLVIPECCPIGHCTPASTSREALADFALLWASWEPALVAQQHREWFP